MSLGESYASHNTGRLDVESTKPAPLLGISRLAAQLGLSFSTLDGEFAEKMTRTRNALRWEDSFIFIGTGIRVGRALQTCFSSHRGDEGIKTISEEK